MDGIVFAAVLALVSVTAAAIAIFAKQVTEHALKKVVTRDVTIAGQFGVDWAGHNRQKQ